MTCKLCNGNGFTDTPFNERFREVGKCLMCLGHGVRKAYMVGIPDAQGANFCLHSVDAPSQEESFAVAKEEHRVQCKKGEL